MICDPSLFCKRDSGSCHQAQGRIIVQELLEEILDSLDSANEGAQAITRVETLSSTDNLSPQYLGLQASVIRLHAFLSVEKACNLKSERIFSAMNSVLELGTTFSLSAEGLVAPTIKCFELALLWNAEEVSRGIETQDDTLEVLVKESGKLMNWVSVILNGESSLEAHWEAVKTMVDLYMVWSIEKVRGSELAGMGFDLDKPNFLRLWEVVEEKITQDLQNLGSGRKLYRKNHRIPFSHQSHTGTASVQLPSLMPLIVDKCNHVSRVFGDLVLNEIPCFEGQASPRT